MSDDPKDSFESLPVMNRLRAALTSAGVEYAMTHHTPVFTSAEAAAVRGTTLHSGAKALIVKADDEFVMIVLPADLALDSRLLREHVGCRRTRFATKEEVLELTGLTPGSIPPFGSLFGLKTICDERLAENESINFNAGSHADSIHMKCSAYLHYEKPGMASVSKAASGPT